MMKFQLVIYKYDVAKHIIFIFIIFISQVLDSLITLNATILD